MSLPPIVLSPSPNLLLVSLPSILFGVSPLHPCSPPHSTTSAASLFCASIFLACLMVLMALFSDSSWLLRDWRETRMCSADRMYVPRIGTRTSSAAQSRPFSSATKLHTQAWGINGAGIRRFYLPTRAWGNQESGSRPLAKDHRRRLPR
jgi:hypothetical protein